MIAAAALAMAAAGSVADMHDHRRVLIVSAPSAADPALAQQRRDLAGWRHGAADRDVSMVEVIGSWVTGASDSASTLRRRYRLPPDCFAAVLIGKDGHEADRSAKPYPARALEATIDAMPMRRAGLR